MNITEEITVTKPIAKECKFAIHIPTFNSEIPDLHLIKETIHNDDGTTTPNLRFLKDFQRPFWITRPAFRDHQQKKEWEEKEKLLESSCTQSELRFAIAKQLEKPWSRESLKHLNKSPYTYGADVTSTSLIKHLYKTKYPEAISKYTVAVFDTETDVLNGTETVIIATLAFEDRLFTAILKSYVQGINFLDKRIEDAGRKYIGEYLDKRKMTPEIYIADDPVDLLRAIFNKAHEWKPDFMAIWSMDFDIPKVIEVLEKHGVDPADVLCDPSVPRSVRICKYKQGATKKTTASGKVKPINMEERWHTLICTSSFYVIDAMCSYRYIRLSEQAVSGGYSLDNILEKELGIRKLKFKEADHLSKLAWHEFMQANYKIEYIIYNMFDCISMLELDDKTKDLSYTLPAFSDTTDFSEFKSQPRRIVDSFYHYIQKDGYVTATLGAMEEIVDDAPEIDEDGYEVVPGEKDEVLDLKNWIVTLPAYNTVPGNKIILEDPTLSSGFRCHVYDTDSVSAYPKATSVANVSKSTTKREIIRIDGIDELTFRMQNINLLAGCSNAIDYSCQMFQLPKPVDLLEAFMNS